MPSSSPVRDQKLGWSAPINVLPGWLPATTVSMPVKFGDARWIVTASVLPLKSAALPHPCIEVPTGFPDDVWCTGAAQAPLPAAVQFALWTTWLASGR